MIKKFMFPEFLQKKDSPSYTRVHDITNKVITMESVTL